MSRKTKKPKGTTTKKPKRKKRRMPPLLPLPPLPRQPTAPPRNICALCQEPHEGNSEESFTSLAVLDPEAAVFYDRDVVSASNVTGLCGPRFRNNGFGLYAHYGSPGGPSYVVYQWNPGDNGWRLIIESVRNEGPLAAAGGDT